MSELWNERTMERDNVTVSDEPANKTVVGKVGSVMQTGPT